eukprot:12382820-Prorocentrum_lima.AAC.1
MPLTAAMKINQIVLHYEDALLQLLAVSLLVHYILVDIATHWILCVKEIQHSCSFLIRSRATQSTGSRTI